MKLTIAHLTDIHLGEPFPKERGVDARAQWEQVLNDVRDRGIHRLIFGGDIGAPSSLPYFKSSLEGFEWMISPGNHDLSRQGVPHLENLPGKDGHYSFSDEGPYRFICMDSSTGAISSQQASWLQQSLQTELKIILAVHHPILPVPSYIDSKHALKGREQIQKILHSAQKEISIISGHYHLEDERQAGKLRQMVTPAASYLIEKSEQLIFRPGLFGYRILEISPQKIESNVIYLETNL